MADFVVTIRALAPVVNEIQVFDVRGAEEAKRDAEAGVAADIKLLKSARVDVARGAASEVQVLRVEERRDRRARRPQR